VADEIARGDLLDLSGSLPAVEMRLLAVHVRGVGSAARAAAWPDIIAGEAGSG